MASDTDFCPECGNILPIPEAEETVSCLDCGFKVNARVVDVETYEIKLDNKGEYRKKEEYKDAVNAESLIQQNIGQEDEAVKQIQNVPSESSTELHIDCAISSCPCYDVSIPADVSPPAAPSDPDVRLPNTAAGHKRNPSISSIRAVKRSKLTESTSRRSETSSNSRSNVDKRKKTILSQRLFRFRDYSDSESRKDDKENKDNAEKEKKEDEKSGGSSYFRNCCEVVKSCIFQKNQSVCWDDIADLEEEKNLLAEAVLLPMWMTEFLERFPRPKSILIVGPPGTGKTMLAKAVATACRSTFFNVSPLTISKYRGPSGYIVNSLFEMAQHYLPSTVFIDEIDSVCSRRESDSGYEARFNFKKQLLLQMKYMTKIHDRKRVVTLLAATNCPWEIDEDICRGFQKCIYIPFPNASGREAQLKINLREVEVCPDLDLEEVANSLEGYSGADIANVCREAAMMAMRRKTTGLTPEEIHNLSKEELDQPVSSDDFREAIKNINKSVSKEDLQKYDKWMAEFRSTWMEEFRDASVMWERKIIDMTPEEIRSFLKEKSKKPVSVESIINTLKNFKKSLSDEYIEKYNKWVADYMKREQERST